MSFTSSSPRLPWKGACGLGEKLSERQFKWITNVLKQVMTCTYHYIINSTVNNINSTVKRQQQQQQQQQLRGYHLRLINIIITTFTNGEHDMTLVIFLELAMK